MAEALAVAGSVVGIVSLGIQLTKGLLSYYGSYKDRDSDISSLCASLESLSEILELLSKTIGPPAIFDKSIKDSVEKNVNHVASRVKILEEELQKVQDAKSPKPNSQPAMRRHMRRAYYPFKEETLKKIQQTVIDARNNLNLALELLHLGSISTIHSGLVSLMRSQEGTETQNILHWLSSRNFRQQQEDLLNQRHPGTGKWLLRDSEFLQWAEGDKRTVWCRGGPGVGKTILASTVIEFLEGDMPTQDVGLAFLYCDHKSKQSQTTNYFIGAIIRQIVEQRHAIPDNVQNLYRQHRGRGTNGSLEERLDLLRSLAQDFSDVYIVADALDECIDKDGQLIWNHLVTQLENYIPNLYLLCTSRNIEDTSGILASSSVIDIRADSADLKGYVIKQIKFKGHLDEFCQRDINLRDRIVEKVVQRSDGMFLAARLYVESLALMSNLRAIKRALDKLPTTIDGNYDEAMERIQQQPQSTKSLGLRTLLWIVYVERPLQLEELQHAVAIDELEEDDESIPEDCLTPPTLIINACVGLIKIDEKSNVVRLIHTTTQEYFDRRGAEYFPNPHESIGRACLTYLMLGTFAKGPYSTHAEYGGQLSQNPLLRYAALNLASHIHKTAGSGLDGLSLRFLLDERKFLCLVQAIFYRNWYPVQEFPKNFTGMHYVAYFGLKNIAQLLFDIDGVEVNSKDSHHQTPLAIAAREGHQEIVKLLLNTGSVEVDSKDLYDQTPLALAARKGHEEVVKLLLNTGSVDVNSRDRSRRTPLSVAVREGHEEVVKLLLNTGSVDVNSRDRRRRTPLLLAVREGHEEMVRLLLNTGSVDVNTRDEDNWTPLSLAAIKGHEEIVRLLVNTHGVDVNYGAQNYMTPLSLATMKGHEEIVRLLVNTHGVYVNYRDRNSWTPLMFAANSGNEEIVKLLLNTPRVEINTKNYEGETALSVAKRLGHEGIIKLLQEAGRSQASESAVHGDSENPNDGNENMVTEDSPRTRIRKLLDALQSKG